MSNSNTVPKQLKPFVKGDPRINRKGRPRSFDGARLLAQQIAHEIAKIGEKDLIIGDHKVTVTEAILRQWAESRDARLQQAFIKIAYGEAPQTIQHQGIDRNPIKIVVVYEDKHGNNGTPEEDAP
jgi:hypothetical protein